MSRTRRARIPGRVLGWTDDVRFWLLVAIKVMNNTLIQSGITDAGVKGFRISHKTGNCRECCRCNTYPWTSTADVDMITR